MLTPMIKRYSSKVEINRILFTEHKKQHFIIGVNGMKLPVNHCMSFMIFQEFGPLRDGDFYFSSTHVYITGRGNSLFRVGTLADLIFEDFQLISYLTPEPHGARCANACSGHP